MNWFATAVIVGSVFVTVYVASLGVIGGVLKVIEGRQREPRRTPDSNR